MGKNNDRKERLPFQVENDGKHSLRLKLKELKSGVGKIPRRMWSSLVIVAGIFAIILIALFTGQQGTQNQNLADDFNSDIIVDDTGHLQARVPDAPEFKLNGNGLNLEEDASKEPAETTAKVTTNPEAAEGTPAASLTTIYPLKRQGMIITDYGWYLHPVYETYRFHPGVDIRCKKGDLLMAAAPGKVLDVTESEQESVLITIDHENGWKTVYGQVDEPKVIVGDQVVKGQEIGIIGQSASAIEPHLHFEIRKGEDSVDPTVFLE